MTKKLELATMIQTLKDLRFENSIEKELLQKKLIRQLYKELGDPKEEDFEDEFEAAGGYWKKQAGYTTWISTLYRDTMELYNNEPTKWNIERPSVTKINIVERYRNRGWRCRVEAYNVICEKYVKHPKYEGIWVYFYSSRDCNKYEYVIELGENE